MLPLKFPRLWMGLGWLFVVGVIVGSLMPGGVVSLPSNDKLLHFGAYLLLTIWFCGLYGKLRHYLVVALVLVGLGAALDAAQGMLPYRSFDIRDIAANSLGIGAGVLLAMWLIGGWCQKIERRFIKD